MWSVVQYRRIAKQAKAEVESGRLPDLYLNSRTDNVESAEGD